MKKLILSISIIGLIFVGCSDDDNPVVSSGTDTGTFTEGTYNMTSATVYEGADCSGVGITGFCSSDQTATTEATCPAGLCMVDDDDVAAVDQAACTTAEGTWNTGICLSDETATTEATCVGACYGTSGNLLEEAADEAACEAHGYDWEGWENFGWESIADDGWDLTFGANGVLTDSDGETNAYTVDGTTITIAIAGCCYDEDTDACTDATTETACTDGEWEDAETLTATLNADGTISIEMSNPDECYGYVGAEEPADETACNASMGDWEEASCYSLVFTLSTD